MAVSYGEFCGQSPFGESTELAEPPSKLPERPQSMDGPLEQGPTIIYVPTRKETIRIAKFLCSKGVKAAAYNAGLAKSHLRRVHKEFHEDALNVVVATVAFGMGIDKLNVRRIIHYGWPQSLEAYYQEAGRAGRDGKSADCIMYANLSRIPTLLPNKRSEEQKTHAYKMLSDCFKYGMNTSQCRAKVLVEYFGENFRLERCMSCDICGNGPPDLQNLKEEANIFMQVVAAHHKHLNCAENPFNDFVGLDVSRNRGNEKPSLRTFVTKIREHSQKFLASDQLWWRGLARILEDKGFIREGSLSVGVQVRCPEPTERGLRFLESAVERDFYAYPEADMLLSSSRVEKPFSSFSEWGKGWADPEIRRQRLAKMKSKKNSRVGCKRKSRSQHVDLKTVRGRLTAKLSKLKR